MTKKQQFYGQIKIALDSVQRIVKQTSDPEKDSDFIESELERSMSALSDAYTVSTGRKFYTN